MVLCRHNRRAALVNSPSLCPRLSMASTPLFKARLDYESSLPKHLFESFVFKDAQMTVRPTR